MHHVADEHRLLRIQRVGVQDFANLFPLVHDLRVGDLEIFLHPEPPGLDFEMRGLDRAQ